MRAYYNENDPFAAEWSRELIREGEITEGRVDGRSIVEVEGIDVAGYERVHLFAGIATRRRIHSCVSRRDGLLTVEGSGCTVESVSRREFA